MSEKGTRRERVHARLLATLGGPVNSRIEEIVNGWVEGMSRQELRKGLDPKTDVFALAMEVEGRLLENANAEKKAWRASAEGETVIRQAVANFAAFHNLPADDSWARAEVLQKDDPVIRQLAAHTADVEGVLIEEANYKTRAERGFRDIQRGARWWEVDLPKKR